MLARLFRVELSYRSVFSGYYRSDLLYFDLDVNCDGCGNKFVYELYEVVF